MITRRDMPHIQALEKNINDSLASDADRAQRGDESEKDRKLKELLQGNQIAADSDKQIQEHDLKEQGANNRFQQAQDFVKNNPQMGVSISTEGAALTPKPINPMAAFRQQSLEQNKMEGLSKRYDKINGFNSALDEINEKTNVDGSGGILSNPNAKLKSTGTLLNSVPTGALGLAELLGGAPKGSADERKALERILLEYQKSMSGMRVTDQARTQEKAAMGWVTSGDPALVAKGVRALAKNVANSTKTIQAGYAPNVRDQVHSVMGDPMDRYANIYDDNAHQAPQAPAAGQAPAQPQQAQPPGQSGAPIPNNLPPTQDPDELRYQQLKQKYGR